MSSRVFLVLLSAAAVGTGTGCSSSSGGSSSSASSALNTMYTALKESMPGSSASFSLAKKNFSPFANHTDFASAIWPTVNDPGVLTNTGAQFLGELVDEDEAQSVLGRVKNALMISCLLDLYGTKDATGKLAVGSGLTIKIKNSWANAPCPSASTEIPALLSNAPNVDSSGEVPITLTVTDVSTSSGGVYDRKVEMPGASNPQFSGSDQEMFLKISGSDVTFAHDEWSTTTTRYASYIKYEHNPRLLRFQHANKSANLEQFYRFYLSEASDKAALIADIDPNGSTEVLTALAAKPSALDMVTVSQSYTDIGGSADGTDRNGCFDFSGPTMTGTDAAFGSCNGVTGILASDAAAIVATFGGLTPSQLDMTSSHA